jgi:hypothetical protein
MLVVVALAGTGLATAPAGQAAPAAATREAELAGAVRCRDIPRGIDFTGTVRVTAPVPDSVAPGERFTIHPAVTLTADPPVAATPVDVSLFAPVSSGGVARIALPTSDATAVTLQAGVTGPVTLTFTSPGTATMRLDGSVVSCFTTSSTGELSIPVVPPTDGSQQTFDARGTATCQNITPPAHEFGMRGVAPATVAPGEPVAITFDWQGLASMLQDRATVTVTGVTGGPRTLTFTGINGSRGIHLDAGPAAAGGTVRFELTGVESSLQVLNPPSVNYAHCRFPDGGPTVTVPITGSPTATSSTTTTTTTTTPGHRAPPFAALIRRLLCVVFRVC